MLAVFASAVTLAAALWVRVQFERGLTIAVANAAQNSVVVESRWCWSFRSRGSLELSLIPQRPCRTTRTQC